MIRHGAPKLPNFQTPSISHALRIFNEIFVQYLRTASVLRNSHIRVLATFN